ncbi:dienelactone hydrolase family protein [Thioalkalivibrio sp. XN279]|uniref:dienelactone hydrolase family protein n=1 Tax=Thioalkalivibrio sp. XN279 TaxID=2714953 RepID=UPI00140A11E6|nr:dienelactone hydrolase family protein [Thioalkalivibrio sp. XN279]NHA13512.1 dienelactone hydrolase family protein [Thioalkalivibrio sp. XN279]
MRKMLLLLALVAACQALPAAEPVERGAGYVEAMAREHAGDQPVAGAAGGEAAAGVVGAEVDYGPGRGYLARPAGTPRAGLVVIHEWWGLNENIREMSNRLAAEGYLALAVDLYEGEVAGEPGEARTLMQALMGDEDRAERHLGAALRWLEDEGGVAQVGSIGWCLGGAMSLRLALQMPEELDAAVIYYGRLVTEPAELAPLRMPILGIFGGQDRGIPVESVREFEMALQALGKTHEIVIYDDADHAFANPSGTRYQPEAAADAWRRTLAFLDEHL